MHPSGRNGHRFLAISIAGVSQYLVYKFGLLKWLKGWNTESRMEKTEKTKSDVSSRATWASGCYFIHWCHLAQVNHTMTPQHMWLLQSTLRLLSWCVSLECRVYSLFCSITITFDPSCFFSRNTEKTPKSFLPRKKTHSHCIKSRCMASKNQITLFLSSCTWKWCMLEANKKQ